MFPSESVMCHILGVLLSHCIRSLDQKYGLNIPPYPGCEQIVELEPHADSVYHVKCMLPRH